MNCVGWDEMLEIRAGVFLMKEDVVMQAKGRTRGQEAKGGQVKGGEEGEKGEGREEGVSEVAEKVGGMKMEEVGEEGEEGEYEEGEGEVNGEEEREEGKGVRGDEQKQGESRSGKVGGAREGERRGETSRQRPLGEGVVGGITVAGEGFGHRGEEGEGKARSDALAAGGRGGAVTAQTGEGAQGGSGSVFKKAVCKPWLDSVFHSLYEDLKAYFAWLSEEEKWAEEDAKEDLSDDGLDERMLSSAEWLYRADIAKRLQNLSDAERAYRSAAFVRTCPKAWVGLLDMYANEGCLKETLLAAHELLDCYEAYKAHPAPPVRLTT